MSVGLLICIECCIGAETDLAVGSSLIASCRCDRTAGAIERSSSCVIVIGVSADLIGCVGIRS